MSITVTLDAIGQSNSVEVTYDRVSITRGIIVEGVTGAASLRLWNAYSASGVPQAGDSHPTVTNMYVSKVSLAPISPDQFAGTVLYENLIQSLLKPSTSTPAQISIGASVQEQQTNIDKDGNPITVLYTGDIADGQGSVDHYGGDPVAVQKPQCTFTYSRLEPSSPQTNATTYVGKVNSASFLGDAASTWLCSRIQGTSEDGGNSYKVNYEFIRSDVSGGWIIDCYYTIPKTGTIPEDVLSGANVTGVGSFNMYPSADFTALSLY